MDCCCVISWTTRYDLRPEGTERKGDGVEGWQRGRCVIDKCCQQYPRAIAKLERPHCLQIGINEPEKGSLLAGIDGALVAEVKLRVDDDSILHTQSGACAIGTRHILRHGFAPLTRDVRNDDVLTEEQFRLEMDQPATAQHHGP